MSKMNAELRVAELLLKSNGNKLKTTLPGIFIPANRDKISHLNEN